MMALVGYWYCQDCCEVIPRDELRITHTNEWHTWLDDCPAELFYEAHCPYCGSELLDEAEYCDMCGEPCNPKDLEDGLCEVCRKEKAATHGGA